MPLSSHPGGSLFEWMDMTAVPFLAQNGDMGGNLAEAHQFVASHKEFANQTMVGNLFPFFFFQIDEYKFQNREPSIMSQLGQMQDREKVIQFEKSYRKLKETVDNRIQLGENYEAVGTKIFIKKLIVFFLSILLLLLLKITNFAGSQRSMTNIFISQVHRFAKDLEASFDALTALLDTNRDFTNEKVAAQMNNVFQMIRETLGQEKQQGWHGILRKTSKNDDCRREIHLTRRADRQI